MKRCLLVVLVLGCAKKLPSHDERCSAAADHLAAVSTAKMPDGDRKRVLMSCASWSDETLACLMATKNDADIDRCK
jgi:hypothetical protein